MNKNKLKTLVLGLGNPILSDDSVGCRVAMALREKLDLPDVDIREASIAGLDFLDVFSDYDRTIIIDSIQTKQGKPGQIYRCGPEILTTIRHTGAPHDFSLASALQLGKKLNMTLPREIIIFAIEAADVVSFSEDCTPAVAQAIQVCVDMIIKELQKTS
jgi:hydrogenase maturation protease